MIRQNTSFLSQSRKIEQIALGLTGLVIVIVLWQFVVSVGLVSSFLISSPALILKAIVQQSRGGVLWGNLAVSMLEFVIAYISAAIIGVFIGLVIGWYRRVEYALDPFIWFFYSTPLIAFYPLFVLWFGLGFKTVLALGFLMSLIPIIINTSAGVARVNPLLIRAARSFCANNKQILSKIVLPAALPMVVTGWRLGVERALIGVVIGEMFSSNAGLGFRMSYYGAQLQITNVFVPLVLVILIGLLLTQLLRWVEIRLIKWKV